MADVAALFEPIRLGAIEAPNRILMAPLTRNRSEPDGTPRPWAARYYAQRAGAGLIISEASQISPMGKGYLDTPGIHTDAHVAAWRRITDAVHEAGGRIVCQLWHVGRISHVSLLPGGASPVSSSATEANAKVFTTQGFSPVSPARALTLEEIRHTLDDYRRAAERAGQAGFDGVEVHGANGYLLDQFLRDGANHRQDEYGGALENRLKMHLAAVDAAVEALGPDRVGVRIGPLGRVNDAADAAPDATFDALATALKQRKLAYIHISGTVQGPDLDAFTKRIRDGVTPIIANGGFDRARGAEWVANRWADAIAYGVPFLANPDLPERFRRGAELNPPNKQTFYGGDERGYTDYPSLADL